MSERRNWKEIGAWKNVSDTDWNDWRWQVSNRITTVEELKEIINLTPEEEKKHWRDFEKFPTGNNSLLRIFDGRR